MIYLTLIISIINKILYKDKIEYLKVKCLLINRLKKELTQVSPSEYADQTP